MKIIYGVNGQGFGHAMRAKVVLDFLISQNHQVSVVCFNQSFNYLKNYFDCFEIQGWELVYKKNEVKYLATAVKDAKKFPRVVKSFNKLRKHFDEFEPQIVITDYEPMTSLLAKIKKLPCISVGNHHFVSNCKIKFPWRYLRDYWAVRVINEAWTPYAGHYFITSFAKEKIIKKNTTLVAPILQSDIFQAKKTDGDYVLIYTTSEFESLLDKLKGLKQKFIVYGLNKEFEKGNIVSKKFSRQGFVDDLAGCKAVIANAGFTLITEALYLQKPFLALPVKKQFEQIINAVYLEKMGYGDYAFKLDKKVVQEFLANLEKYEQALQSYPKHSNDKFLKLLQQQLKK